ncbi:MAG: DUF1203 domain-containing protein [Caulobacterales bacterium]|nr:DUF1203 domain-containing protein [Caulobacterales bacterium]
MSFVVTGLPSEPFQHLFGLSDEALAGLGVVRKTVDAPVGFPCRITLEDAPVGETVLLLNYEHQPAETPYRSRHAIFVREGRHESARYVDEAPPALAARRYISLRAFDGQGNIVGSDVAPGTDLPPAIEKLLALPDTAYIHAHNAGHGCYAARIDRA